MTAVAPRRKSDHVMPPDLAERIAPPAMVRTWSDITRRSRTCWYCGVTYLRATDADKCELAAEGTGH